jgi:hypothetical protein
MPKSDTGRPLVSAMNAKTRYHLPAKARSAGGFEKSLFHQAFSKEL